MAVLVEGVSVIVRKDAIAKKYRGGWRAFVSHVPNATFCDDEEIARVGFMTPDDVNAYVGNLEQEGLIFEKDGKAVDLAVVDQFAGPTVTCEWIEFALLKYNENGWISACWFRRGLQDPTAVHTDRLSLQVATPVGWTFENSLSKSARFVRKDQLNAHLKFLRSERDLDVYLDLQSGKEVYIGRPAIAPQSEASAATALKRIANEALQLEAQLEEAETAGKREELKRLRDRLSTDLLPEARNISKGSGSNLAFSFFVVGLVERILGMLAEAEASYKRSLAIQPNVINALLELTLCLGQQHKPQEALAVSRKAIMVCPVSAAAWGNLAMCHIQLGHKPEARAALDKAVLLDPADRKNLASGNKKGGTPFRMRSMTNSFREGDPNDNHSKEVGTDQAGRLAGRSGSWPRQDRRGSAGRPWAASGSVHGDAEP